MSLEKAALSLDELMETVPFKRTFIYDEINRGNLKTIKAGRRRIVTIEQRNDWLKKLEQECQADD